MLTKLVDLRTGSYLTTVPGGGDLVGRSAMEIYQDAVIYWTYAAEAGLGSAALKRHVG